MHNSNTVAQLEKLLVYTPFVIPLLYVYPIVGAFDTELYRAVFLIVAGLIVSVYLLRDLKPKNLQPWQISSLSFVGAMFLSLLFAANRSKALFGITGDYQGFLVQVSGIALAYFSSRRIQWPTYWLRVADITGIVCLLSIIFDSRNIFSGYRSAGLLLHATGLGLYASITLGINIMILNKYRRNIVWRVICILGAFMAVILSASRIGLLAAILSLLLVALYKASIRKQVCIIISGFIVCAGLSYLFLSPVQRLSSPSRIESGAGYRFELYSWSLGQARPTLFGVGTSQIDDVLKPTAGSPAPPDIQHTILYDYPLWYTHSQFIDIFIQYGFIGLLLFVYVLVSSMKNIFKNLGKEQDHVLILSIIFMAIFFHLLLNTPSIELLPVVWLVIFCGLGLKQHVLTTGLGKSHS